MLGPLFTETSGNNEAGPTRPRYDKLLLAAEPQWNTDPPSGLKLGSWCRPVAASEPVSVAITSI